MEIYIMRHGEPDTREFTHKITYKDFINCLALYKNCGILDTSKPEECVVKKFKNYSVVMASNLKRSIDSASLLSAQKPVIIDSMFAEIEDTFIPIPFLKLKPKMWGNIFILLWYFRLFDAKKAFRDGKARAKQCARRLVDLAEANDKVLFVGHGFINIYIAKELRRMGWVGPKMPSKHYWDFAVYQEM